MLQRYQLPLSSVVSILLGVAASIPAYSSTSAVISLSTRIGGSGISNASGIATDASGNIYVAGWNDATDFPTINAAQPLPGGGTDAFVAKIAPTGGVLFCTFLGGRGEDRASAIAVDSAGNSYISGWTYSTDFPTTGNAPQRRLTGTRNAFLTKLDPGGRILFSTYLGGGYDAAKGIAVDPSGAVFVTGETASSSFPTAHPIQSTLNGQQNAFVTAFDAAGAIIFSTYLGGCGTDSASAIAVDTAGNLYIAGYTDSSNFPVLNAVQARNDGRQTGFAAKIGAARTLVYSTYIGGGGTLGYPEMALAIDVDSTGAAYIAGVTSSPAFPVSSGALKKNLSGGLDAFVVELDASGKIVFSTYLGGAGADYATAIRVRKAGQACLAGYTSSVDFPVLNAVQGEQKGLYDAFVTCLQPDSSLGWSTFIGGGNSDAAAGIAVNASGISVVGQTASLDFPRSGASRGNTLDAFIATMVEPPPPPTLTRPGNGSTLTANTAILQWDNLSQADEFHVYLGTSSPPPLLASTAENSYVVPTLQPGAKYYWRIEAESRAGVSTSDIWSFTVVPTCIYTLSPASENIPSSGGTGSVSLSAPSGCTWAAATSAGWLAITSGRSGTGSGIITYSAASNPGTSSRTATISIGTGTFTLTQLGTSPMRTGDLDGNGTPDLFWQNTTTGQAAVWYLGGPNGTAAIRTAYIDPRVPGWELISIADFDRNGIPDLVWQNTATRQIGVWYMSGTQTPAVVGSAYPAPGTYAGWKLVSVADVDCNGTPDLIWQHDITRSVAIWFMSGPQGTDVLGSTYAAPGNYSGWTLVGVADLDHNGVPDLLWQNDSTRSVGVWFMSGSRSNLVASGSEMFGGGPYPNWRVVAVVDMNGDGAPDLIWQNDVTRGVVVWYLGGSRGTTVANTAVIVADGYAGWRALGPK